MSSSRVRAVAVGTSRALALLASLACLFALLSVGAPWHEVEPMKMAPGSLPGAPAGSYHPTGAPFVCTGRAHLRSDWPLVLLGLLALVGAALAWRRPTRVGWVPVALGLLLPLAFELSHWLDGLTHFFDSVGPPTVAQRIYDVASSVALVAILLAAGIRLVAGISRSLRFRRSAS